MPKFVRVPKYAAVLQEHDLGLRADEELSNKATKTSADLDTASADDHTVSNYNSHFDPNDISVTNVSKLLTDDLNTQCRLSLYHPLHGYWMFFY